MATTPFLHRPYSVLTKYILYLEYLWRAFRENRPHCILTSSWINCDCGMSTGTQFLIQAYFQHRLRRSLCRDGELHPTFCVDVNIVSMQCCLQPTGNGYPTRTFSNMPNTKSPAQAFYGHQTISGVSYSLQILQYVATMCEKYWQNTLCEPCGFISDIYKNTISVNTIDVYVCSAILSV